jgi:hypothetical protein
VTARSRARSVVITAAILFTATTHAQSNRISSDEMKQWLTYISSDELQGRQVFTEGLGLAADYIADHLKEWHVRPGGDAGTYFQVVEVLGVRTTSRSRVAVTVNGQTRTFKDGEGVTFPRNAGAKQTLTAPLEFVGYGITYSPLELDDYAGRAMKGKIAIYIGRRAPGMGANEDRLVNARARFAVETEHAAGAIGPAAPARANAAAGRGAGANAPAAAGGRGGANNAQRVDFTTVQRLDLPIAPQFTAGDEFYRFVLSASGQDYDALTALAGRQEALPKVDLHGATIQVTIDADYTIAQTRLSRNVVGIVDGTDARLRDTYVLLGAHYDHVGYQQFTGTVAAGENAIASCTGQHRPEARPGDIINNGADDDGSGTVSLMAIAKAFATGQKPRRSLMFIWHTGEEAGLYGSRYMADHPVVPLDHVSAELNIDMVGRNECDDPARANTLFLVGSDRISTELHNVNEAANAAQPMPMTLDYTMNDIADTESLYTRSDHYSYASKGIPIIFFTTGLHRDYHYVTDEVDKILFPKMTRVAQLVYTTATRLANLDHFPVRDNQGPRMGRGQTGRIN